MKVIEDYRPKTIEFTASTSEAPDSLGRFKTSEEARKFIAENLLGFNTKLTTLRMMDDHEIEKLRSDYSHILEHEVPEYRKELGEKALDLERAKKAAKTAEEEYNAKLSEVQRIANEVTSGVTEIRLDQEHTWEFIHNNKRFYYTYIDKELKLAAVSEISSYEEVDLISSSETNREFFSKQKAASNG